MDFSNKRIETMRRFIAILAIIVTIYYLYWRVTETLNPNALFFSWLLYGAEFFGAVSTFLFYFTVWKPKTRVAPPPIKERSVDVFIPTMNEPVAILRKTLLACNELRYPHRTLVLDDGSRPEIKAMCEELNCVYLARKTHDHAKAGNLNFGLQHSKAEFIAVFDADHVPLSNFIDKLIGYFKDSKVGFVQAPQEFYNIDSIQHRTERKERKMWGEQYLFFSLIQPGKDYWNAAFFVGSCAIIRRKALDEIGGFATGSITEDMLTSIRIHAKKWSSVYHNENLAFGIAAETLKPFSIQRQRWGIGNWQVFVKANPLFIRGLSLSQRIAYLSSMIYPLEGLQKIIFYLTPPIALFTGVLPMQALDVNYLVHFIPYFFLSTYGFSEMSRGVGGQIMLEQYSMAKFVTYLKTVVMPFISKKSKKFDVTPKGAGDDNKVPITLIIPPYLVTTISFIAMLWALVQTIFDQRTDSFIVAVNCFWALYNSGLALAVIHFDYKKLFQRRTTFRIPDVVLADYRLIGDTENKDVNLAVAEDITEDGMSMLAVNQAGIGKEFEVNLMLPKNLLTIKCTAVRVRSLNIAPYSVSHIGLRFMDASQGAKDILSRYLHESAIKKFLKDYTIGYKTYVARRFGKKDLFARAARSLAYIPAVIHGESGNNSYAAIKDISNTGIQVTTREMWPQGALVTLDVVLGKDRILLAGSVVRSIDWSNDIYPEFFVGIHFNEESAKEVDNLLKIAQQISEFILE